MLPSQNTQTDRQIDRFISALILQFGDLELIW